MVIGIVRLSILVGEEACSGGPCTLPTDSSKASSVGKACGVVPMGAHTKHVPLQMGDMLVAEMVQIAVRSDEEYISLHHPPLHHHWREGELIQMEYSSGSVLIWMEYLRYRVEGIQVLKRLLGLHVL